MNYRSAYTDRDLANAVNLSALLGWLVIASPFVFRPTYLLFWVTAIGMPIAFGACWLIGVPTLRIEMFRPISWFGAVCWGGIISFAIASPFFFQQSSLLISLVPWVAAIGLPIAIGACWSIGVPILRIAILRPISRLSAIFWGGLISIAFTSPFASQQLSQFLWIAAIGLPIAFGACWLIGAPILRIAMLRPISWLGAVLWGGLASFAIATIFFLIARFLGLLQRPSSGEEFTSSVEGILSSYGWWIALPGTKMFVLLGIVIALFIRAVIGAGKIN